MQNLDQMIAQQAVLHKQVLAYARGDQAQALPHMWRNIHSKCKDPSLWKENKVSNGAEDGAKSTEVGTHKVGHGSDLSGGQSSTQAGKFWKTKCDITLRLV